MAAFVATKFTKMQFPDGHYVEDLKEATRVVIGSSNKVTSECMVNILNLKTTLVIHTTVVEAEIAKYVDNAFHALKIAFSNEVAALSKHFSASPDIVLEVLAADQRLNISAAYLKQGKAYGGRCLPKDMKALENYLHSHNLNLPILNAIDASNLLQARRQR